MSEHEKDAPLSDAANERLIDLLRHPHPTPLTRSELEDLREMLAEWTFRSRQREEFRKKWPLIAAAGSLLFTGITVAVSLIVNFFQSGHPK